MVGPGDDFHHGKAFAFQLVLEGFLDCGLRFIDIGRSVAAGPRQIGGSGQLVQDLAHVHGIAVLFRDTPFGAVLAFMPNSVVGAIWPPVMP